MKTDCSPFVLEHEIKSTESVEEINLIAQLNTIEDGKSEDITNELEATEGTESDVGAHLENVDSNETKTTESEVLGEWIRNSNDNKQLCLFTN